MSTDMTEVAYYPKEDMTEAHSSAPIRLWRSAAGLCGDLDPILESSKSGWADQHLGFQMHHDKNNQKGYLDAG